MSISRRTLILASLAAPALTATSGNASAKTDATSHPKWQLPASRPFKMIENQWIPMADGIRLAARFWLPETTDRSPVVFEYIPYRHRDAYRPRDDVWGPQLAAHGIAYVRVDVRGSGDSEGVMTDEYDSPELNDGVTIIAWLARQPWSNGAVGMRGISWGGINTLQVASMAPPELKAIMPMGCCDVRFTDDAHYIGGALGQTNFEWGVQFKGVMSAPPDPEIAGAQWESLWRQRLHATPSILAKWLSHQRYDAYWQRGSIAVNYADIRCPVYVVDGWIDTYSNPVGRLLEKLSVPRKGLIGPWGHSYPDQVSPGPGLDWIFEEVRWWQQWLQGRETGIMNEPMFRAYMPYTTPWESYPNDLPGRWIAESVWPPVSNTNSHPWHLNGGGALSKEAGAVQRVPYLADKIVGLNKLQWLPFPPSGMPTEQSPDDMNSLTFTSSVLGADLEILGYPQAHIRVASNVPVAKLAVRLTDIAPDGKSWLVSWGLINLTHRTSHEVPTALVAGEFYDVDLKLMMIAHRFKRGHKIRIAISESLWPMVWPSPKIATLTLELGSSSIVLPERPVPASEEVFPIPVRHASSQAMASLRGSPPHDGAKRGADGRVIVKRDSPEASVVIEGVGTTLTRGGSESSEITEGEPNSCVWRQSTVAGFHRDQWDCHTEASYEVTSTETMLNIKETLIARRADEIIYQQETTTRIERDLL
jgi:uncharacterized protein